MPKVHTTTNGSANGRAAEEKGHDYRKLFTMLGVVFGPVNGSDQAVAESCPLCDKEGRFYLNVTTGRWDCKKCRESGNHLEFLTKLHKKYWDQTTAADYSALGKKRGIAPQTLRLHELAYDRRRGCWLIPFRSSKENLVNLQLYFPDKPKGKDKYNLPLPMSLYGFDKLMAAPVDKPVFLCEGVFDAIAADYSIGAEHRGNYVVVATPGGFKEAWVEHFKDRKVRALYHNDDAGRRHTEKVRQLLGESGVTAEMLVLKWPDATNDVNDWVRAHPPPRYRLPGFVRKHSYRVTAEPKLDFEDGWARRSTKPAVIDWIWPDRLRCGSYCSFSGQRGTMKSTLMWDLIARYTKGEPMPFCERVGLPAGHVLYITAEDSREDAWERLRTAGADLDNVTIHAAVTRAGAPFNVLDHLAELEEKIRRHGTRLVVIDGQNSCVGTPYIGTDMQARANVTNPLHQFAQKLNLALVGLRNDDEHGRPLGPQSMADLGRCIWKAERLTPKGQYPPYFRLIFVRISDAAERLHPPIPFSVDEGVGPARGILWGKVPPAEDPELKAQAKPIMDDFARNKEAIIAEVTKGKGAGT
jgi:hypothetical protein